MPPRIKKIGDYLKVQIFKFAPILIYRMCSVFSKFIEELTTMKKTILLCVCTFSLFSLKAQEADYIIRNGKLIDGSGNNWQYKDVAIKQNKIIAVGNLKSWKAAIEIDAKGLVVAPGFIGQWACLPD